MAANKELQSPHSETAPQLSELTPEFIQSLERDLTASKAVLISLDAAIRSAAQSADYGATTQLFSLEQQYQDEVASYHEIEQKLATIRRIIAQRFLRTHDRHIRVDEEKNDSLLAPHILRLTASDDEEEDELLQPDSESIPTKANTSIPEDSAPVKKTRRRRKHFFLVEHDQFPSKIHQILFTHAQSPNHQEFVDYDQLLRPLIVASRNISPNDVIYIKDELLRDQAHASGYQLDIRHSRRGRKKGYRYYKKPAVDAPRQSGPPQYRKNTTNGFETHKAATPRETRSQIADQRTQSTRDIVDSIDLAEYVPHVPKDKKKDVTTIRQVILDSFTDAEQFYRSFTKSAVIPKEISMAAVATMYMRHNIPFNSNEVRLRKFGREENNRWVLTLPEFTALTKLLLEDIAIDEVAEQALKDVKKMIMEEIETEALASSV